MRLFCFPYAGGGASAYRSWIPKLTPRIAVLPVQYPGRESRFREPLVDRWEALIETLAAGILGDLQPPFAFFGHSLGATVAYELTRFLMARGRPGPTHLFVSGSNAVSIRNPRERIDLLPHKEFWENVRSFEGTREETFEHPELMELVEPILRADFRLAASYTHVRGNSLECPVIALGGTQDRETDEVGLDAWRAETQGAFTRRFFPGGHFFIDEQRDAVLQTIAVALA